MGIRNLSKKKTLATSLQKATSLKDSLLGMTQYKNPRAMLFHTRFGIHTFGMKYPIDIIILDNNRKVVAFKPNMKPSRVFLWNPKYRIVLELPEGTIEKTQTEIGDTLSFS